MGRELTKQHLSRFVATATSVYLTSVYIEVTIRTIISWRCLSQVRLQGCSEDVTPEQEQVYLKAGEELCFIDTEDGVTHMQKQMLRMRSESRDLGGCPVGPTASGYSPKKPSAHFLLRNDVLKDTPKRPQTMLGVIWEEALGQGSGRRHLRRYLGGGIWKETSTKGFAHLSIMFLVIFKQSLLNLGNSAE